MSKTLFVITGTAASVGGIATDIHPDPFRPTEFTDRPRDADRPPGAATDLTMEQRFPPPPGAPDGVASPD
jgi:hypothetical protein